jgi:hypothetical protein
MRGQQGAFLVAGRARATLLAGKGDVSVHGVTGNHHRDMEEKEKPRQKERR